MAVTTSLNLVDDAAPTTLAGGSKARAFRFGAGEIGLPRWLKVDQKSVKIATLPFQIVLRGSQVSLLTTDPTSAGEFPTGFLTDQRDGVSSTGVEFPRYYVDSTYVAPTGTVHSPTTAAQLQTAFDTAVAGDVIELVPGFNYQGNFTIPVGIQAGYVHVRTAGYTRVEQRINPLTDGVSRAIISTGNSSPALRFLSGFGNGGGSGANHWWFSGVEIRSEAFGTTIVYIGDLAQTTATHCPSDIVFEECYFHENGGANRVEAIICAGNDCVLLNSWAWGFEDAGVECKAVLAGNFVSGLKVVNNFLSGSGMSFLMGGFDYRISGENPQDIEFRYNHCWKDPTWMNDPNSVMKNHFEIKAGGRTLVEGNYFENCGGGDSQRGHAILLQTINQSGTHTWAEVNDVVMRWNYGFNINTGITLSYSPGANPTQGMRRIAIVQNLFDRMGPTLSVHGNQGTQTPPTVSTLNDGRLFSWSGQIEGLWVQNNTAYHDGPTAKVDANPPIDGAVVTGNITMGEGFYDFHTDGNRGMDAVLGSEFTNLTWSGNLHVGFDQTKVTNYSATNDFVNAVADVGFTDPFASPVPDLTLATSSPYYGQNLGVNHSQLAVALALGSGMSVTA